MRAFWLRWRARRRPLQVAIVGLAIVTWIIVHALLSSAQTARSSWGPATAVIVTTHRLEAGDVIAVNDIETRTLPAIAIPVGALRESPVGRTVVAPVERGEILVAARVADTDVLPAGTRGLAVPLDQGHLHLDIGDRVDVIAVLDPIDVTDGGPPAFVLAANALVTDTSDTAATVAVPTDDAPRIALAMRQGAVVLVLSSTPSRPG
jgi:Flp pilus assembly protein CpaB